jgi:hypothetical protein
MRFEVALAVLVFPIAFPQFLTGCYEKRPHELVLNDFESDSDLDRIDWNCRTLFFLSEEHVSAGRHSLGMKLFPAAYPGLSLKLAESNWSAYDLIALDIDNPQEEMLDIVVRIDDRPDYPDYEDRYNVRYTLLPGSNHLRIPLNSLCTSGTARPLNLRSISQFMFFMVDTQVIYRLYVDHVRLISLTSFK